MNDGCSGSWHRAIIALHTLRLRCRSAACVALRAAAWFDLLIGDGLSLVWPGTLARRRAARCLVAWYHRSMNRAQRRNAQHHTAKAKASFRCPHCGVGCTLGTLVESAAPMVMHALPLCRGFETSSAEEFMRAVDAKRRTN